MIMAYIVLSIMVGVILENFANVGGENRKISMDQLEEFRAIWLKYDPQGSFVVPSHHLLAILQELKAPLGLKGAAPKTRKEMLHHLGGLEIPDHGGLVHFIEVLTAVSHSHAGVDVPVCAVTEKLAKEARAATGKGARNRMDGTRPAANALTNYLVSLLQSRWRGYAMRQQYEKGGAPASNPY